MVKIQNLTNNVVGDSIVIEITVYDNNDIQDVSGSTSKITIVSDLNDISNTKLSEVNGTLVTDGTDGKIKFIIPALDTNNATIDLNYYYDIEVTLASGLINTLMKGYINFGWQTTL